MAESPKSTAFYEGAPLDPNKLNQIITDINVTYGQAVLTNKTVNELTQQFNLIQDCGREPFENIKADKLDYHKITLNNQSFKFGSDQLPLIISATISSDIPDKVVASAVAKVNSNEVYIAISSSKDINRKVWVDWLITQKVKI